MAKTVGQVRFYGDEDKRNFPQTLSYVQLQSGSFLSNAYPITQLGIQTVPGAKIYLNKDKQPIIIGVTGIYELNVDGLAQITDLAIASETLNVLRDKRNQQYLIIDYISDKEG